MRCCHSFISVVLVLSFQGCLLSTNAFIPKMPPVTVQNSFKSKHRSDQVIFTLSTVVGNPKYYNANTVIADSHFGTTTTLFGIPKMFRWLTDQYPNINSRLAEGLSSDKVVDNFYLDMNGIIHPCTHGNSDELVILDETAMFKKIFGYVDR